MCSRMSVVSLQPLTELEINEILRLNSDLIAANSQTLVTKVRIELIVPQHLLEKLSSAVGIPLTSPVPAQLAKGDTALHVDSGIAPFSSTFLYYLTSSLGILVLGDAPYPIEKGAAYVFASGMEHGVSGTADTIRISIGPMSEQGFPVGRPPVGYFATEADAISYEDSLGYGDYTVGTLYEGDIGAITRWRIASNSDGSSSQSVVYTNGDILSEIATDGGSYAYYNLYPADEPEPAPACVNACTNFGSQVQATERSEQDTLDFKRNKAIYVGQTENPKQFRDHATYIQYKKGLRQLAGA
jgi:hypothetical protein